MKYNDVKGSFEWKTTCMVFAEAWWLDFINDYTMGLASIQTVLILTTCFVCVVWQMYIAHKQREAETQMEREIHP